MPAHAGIGWNEVEGFRCDNENWLRTGSCNFKNNAIVSFIVFTQTYFIMLTQFDYVNTIF